VPRLHPKNDLFWYFLAFQTLGLVISYGDGKNVDDVVSHLAQRTFDSAPAVRAAVTGIIGDWLLNLCDRYISFVTICIKFC